jgi:UDP-N-acetylmuramate dehydrogenase
VPERLADHTTLRLGGPVDRFVTATTEDQLVEAVSAADAAGEPCLVLGGGSNLVVADEGFRGTVVRIATTGVTADVDDDDPSCGGAMVTVAAGESWDAFVSTAVERQWIGVEALAGIPGLVGATPIQNVGAYGQEVSQTIASVRVWDRRLRGVRTFANADCGFGYRHSRFKADPGRHVVLSVTFQFRQGDLGAPVTYAELARTLGIEPQQRVPAADVREAVLGLRRAKGMVLDADDHDTWSAGSFFTNPVVPAEQVPDGAPAWPADGGVKTSAAWLIERAGFRKGYGADGVGVSTKHTLALTNRGSGTTDGLLGLAREIRDGVEAAYGIRLVNEPVLVGCSL